MSRLIDSSNTPQSVTLCPPWLRIREQTVAIAPSPTIVTRSDIGTSYECRMPIAKLVIRHLSFSLASAAARKTGTSMGRCKNGEQSHQQNDDAHQQPKQDDPDRIV